MIVTMGCIGSRVTQFRGASSSNSHSESLRRNSERAVLEGATQGRSGATRSVSVTNSNPFGRRSSSCGRRHKNIFSVTVDDLEQGIQLPAKIQVTETDLVLHVKGKLPLSWPLRSLRRYGHEQDLFSFESGRRCATGAGVFCFRCSRAQSLFKLLQSKIHSGVQGPAVGGDASSASLPVLPSTPITSLPNSNTVTGGGFGVVSAGSMRTSRMNSAQLVSTNSFDSGSFRMISARESVPPIPPPPSSSNNTQVGGNNATTSEDTYISDVLQNTPRASVSSVPLSSSSSSPQLAKSVKSPQQTDYPIYMNVNYSINGASIPSSSTTITNTQRNSSPPSFAPRKSIVSTSVDKTNHCPLIASSSSVVPGRISSPSCLLSSSALPQKPQTSKLLDNQSKGITPAANEVVMVSLPPLQEVESVELHYAELDFRTDASKSQSTTGSERLGVFNKHNQLISSYSKLAEPFKPKTESVNENSDEKESFQPSTASLPETAAESDLNIQPLSYATIDFEKTAQLNKSTRSKLALFFDDEGEGDGRNTKKSGFSIANKFLSGTTGL